MNNRRAIVTIGMFDGVHRGHLHLLKQLDSLASELNMQAAVITFDEHPLTAIDPENAPKLIENLDYKRSILGSAYNRKVLVVKVNPEVFTLTAKEFISALKESINVKAVLLGYDSTFGSDQLKDPEEISKELNSIGVKTYLAEKYDKMEVKSSYIRQAIEEGDMIKAKRMIGRPFSMKGTVVKGQHIGTELGFPTANLEIDERMIVPGKGVYAALCLGYAAMLNIGTAPTIRKDGGITIEVNIIEEYHIEDDKVNIKNLYGRELRLIVVKKIREEQKFDSTEELKQQLEKDRKEAIKICDEFVHSRIEMI